MKKRYREAVRDLMARKGIPVLSDESYYGWQDYAAKWHTHQWSDEERAQWGKELDTPESQRRYPGCTWVVPEGVTLVEKEWSEFAGTEADSDHFVGIEVGPVRCACGKYKDVKLRYTSSFRETMDELFGEQMPLTL